MATQKELSQTESARAARCRRALSHGGRDVIKTPGQDEYGVLYPASMAGRPGLPELPAPMTLAELEKYAAVPLASGHAATPPDDFGTMFMDRFAPLVLPQQSKPTPAPDDDLKMIKAIRLIRTEMELVERECFERLEKYVIRWGLAIQMIDEYEKEHGVNDGNR
jgi:hypothetical protein